MSAVDDLRADRRAALTAALANNLALLRENKDLRDELKTLRKTVVALEEANAELMRAIGREINGR